MDIIEFNDETYSRPINSESYRYHSTASGQSARHKGTGHVAKINKHARLTATVVPPSLLLSVGHTISADGRLSMLIEFDVVLFF